MKFNLTLTFNPMEHYIPLAEAADKLGWDTVNVGDGLFFYDETTVDYPYTDSGARYWSANTQFLANHLVKAIQGHGAKRRYLIGNNRGGINGWVARRAIHGVVTKVED